jgi:hypothetical protein
MTAVPIIGIWLASAAASYALLSRADVRYGKWTKQDTYFLAPLCLALGPLALLAAICKYEKDIHNLL